MNNSIIVVDAQDCFLVRHISAYAECLDNIAKQIVKAMRRNDHIMMVEFDSEKANKKTFCKDSSENWPTHTMLNRLVEDYNKRHYVFKRARDGGNEIIKTIRAKKIPHKNLTLMGCYAEACVQDTVITLAKNLNHSQLNIVRNATVSYNGCSISKEKSFKEISFYDNVRVIG